ncbi:MAG TPA: ABC transporter permease [Terriglobia bacterium]|nr:ABC transporter permease [Terriglobia bacterium]
MNPFFRKLRWLTRRDAKEAELREELQFHLEETAEERKAEGLPEEEALWAARRELGNLAVVRERTREVWGWRLLEEFGQDLRYAARTMLHNRAFSALAVLSLALGIGANTAIFSFLDSLLLRPLPVADPDSLVMLTFHMRGGMRGSVFRSVHGRTDGDAKTGLTSGIFPYDAYELARREDAVFSSVFGRYSPGDLHLTIAGQGEMAHAEYVTGDYFRGLGVVPAAGRLILPDDDTEGAPGVTVLSYRIAQGRFGSAANAVGRTILVDSVPFTVAGVAPLAFLGVDPGQAPDVYLPMHASLLLAQPRPAAAWFADGNMYWIYILARLRPGVKLAQAQAQFAGLFHEWVASTAHTQGEFQDLPALAIKQGGRGLDSVRWDYAKPLWILTVLVALILAMACANIANLLLARSHGRAREMAIRLSIGAGRPRLVRQLLTESVLLAGWGGVLGIAVAFWGIRFLQVLFVNTNTGTTLRAELNWDVLAAAAGLSLLTGILFGLAPALRSTRVDVTPALKESGIGVPRGRGRRSSLQVSLGHLLMVSQVAITLVMVVAAGLFVRTLENLRSVALGFQPENVLTFRLDARQAGHRDPEIAMFYENLRERFAALPGVRSASLTDIPLIGDNWVTGVGVSGGELLSTNLMAVGPDFFSTTEIPILRGRGIDEHDGAQSLLVAVVNQRFVELRCGGRNPVGLVLTMRYRPQKIEIVGVSGDARYLSVKSEMSPVVYLPFGQGVLPVDDMTYALRTAASPLGLAAAVRDVVRRVDPRLPVTDLMTETAQIDRTVSQEIAFAHLCAAFAMLALAIACVGLYGTVSYTVARRTGEIGIRMALGAPRGVVVRMILRGVVGVTAAGLAISLPATIVVSKLVQSFLFGVKPNDPASLVAAAAILTGSALLAGYLPARKASRIDPIAAIRDE